MSLMVLALLGVAGVMLVFGLALAWLGIYYSRFVDFDESVAWTFARLLTGCLVVFGIILLASVGADLLLDIRLVDGAWLG